MLVHKVLVNCLVKLAQEKSVVRRTDCLDMTIAVDWDVKPQSKQTNQEASNEHTNKMFSWRGKKISTYT